MLPAAERIEFLEEDIRRKNAALNAAVQALIRLSKTGSLRKEVREAVIRQCLEAQNERLF